MYLLVFLQISQILVLCLVQTDAVNSPVNKWNNDYVIWTRSMGIIGFSCNVDDIIHNPINQTNWLFYLTLALFLMYSFILIEL